VNVTEWRSPSRVLGRDEIEGFYGHPLAESHAFFFETGQLEVPAHGGAFSLKLVLAGQEEYVIGTRALRIRPGELLFINAGEVYASRIRRPCRSLSIFFPPSVVAAAREDLAVGCESPRDVPQVSFSASRATWRLVEQLACCLRQRRSRAAEFAAHSLLAGALGQLRNSLPFARLRGVRKSSTQDELRGRVLRAREYIEAMRGERCSLDELAAIACLSRFHFLRVFKQVFGVSPVAFARSLRAPRRA
jgi:AraC family transcriptional regulator